MEVRVHSLALSRLALRRQGPGSEQLSTGSKVRQRTLLNLRIRSSFHRSARRRSRRLFAIAPVLDAAQRPRLVGGLKGLAEAFAAATPEPHVGILMEYARRLSWSAPLRRLGSIADAFALRPSTGALTPIKPITSGLDHEPGNDEPAFWWDSLWRVRWPRTVNELAAVIGE